MNAPECKWNSLNIKETTDFCETLIYAHCMFDIVLAIKLQFDEIIQVTDE